MTNQEFLAKVSLDQATLESVKIDCNDLRRIYEKQLAAVEDLDGHAQSIVRQLSRCAEVHSIKARVKDPSHLVRKIVRKVLADRSRMVTFNNYENEVAYFGSDWPPVPDLAGRSLRFSLATHFGFRWPRISVFIWPLISVFAGRLTFPYIQSIECEPIAA